ncbi:MAG: hypothetical protein L3J84_06850 [Gammaproteobacteria bacterium]|nr:hypothetical protein [Gammaproteobacteria bacterium]
MLSVTALKLTSFFHFHFQLRRISFCKTNVAIISFSWRETMGYRLGIDLGAALVENILSVGHSTLSRWTVKSRNNKLNDEKNRRIMTDMAKNKRPQGWISKNRFNMVFECDAFDEEYISLPR